VKRKRDLVSEIGQMLEVQVNQELQRENQVFNRLHSAEEMQRNLSTPIDHRTNILQSG
jgi:hypothetical protein